MSKPREFTAIGIQFTQNIRTLLTFVKDIGDHAEAHDRNTISRLTELVQESVGPDLIELIRKEPQEDPAGDDTTGGSEVTVGGDTRPDPPPAAKAELENLLASPHRLRKLLSAMQMAVRESPRQAHVLRCSALVSLASYLEWLIADLLHAYYERFPAALPERSRTLSLADLREIGSVPDAEKLLIRREIDSVLRGSIEDQLEYIRKRLAVEPFGLAERMPGLIELSQRRNALIHNAGRYDGAYLTKVAAALVETYAVGDGDLVEVPKPYLDDAMDLVLVVGVALIQTSWRKLGKDSVTKADSQMNECVYEALTKGQFQLADKLGSLGLGVGLADEASVPKAIGVDEITKEHLEEWPLFFEIRKNDRFVKFLKAHFPEDAKSVESPSEQRSEAQNGDNPIE